MSLGRTLEQLEREAIAESLKAHRWSIRAVAREFGISEASVHERIKRWGLTAPVKPMKKIRARRRYPHPAPKFQRIGSRAWVRVR